MQDKFAIGPVTFVQLVGLATKPQIPSARADGAARAADHPPPSAAAGLGGKAQEPVSDIESSYFLIKGAPTLGLSADPLQAHIGFEAGVDRPDPNVSVPPPKVDPSTSNDFLANPGPTNPPVDGREGPTPDGPDPSGEDGNPTMTAPVISTDPGSSDTILPDKSVSTASVAKSDVSTMDFVFDGETEFGDDEILDFTLAVSDAYLAQSAASVSGMGSGDFDVTLQLQFANMGDWGAFDIIDCSGGHSPEPTLLSFDQLVAPQHQLSTTDAVPPI